MKIEAFVGERVHRYLDFNITLNSELSLFNGINGSGKTTFVQSIVSLIQPDIFWLLETEFDMLQVKINHDGENQNITAAKDQNFFYLKTSSVRGQLKIPLEYYSAYRESIKDRRRPTRLLVRELRQFIENETIRHISDLPTPMFLGLDRTTRKADLQDLEEEYPTPYPQ